jgi:very-short-patch-repair endonuclease
MLERYGVINPMDSQELKDRQKHAVQDKYGVDNVSQIESVQAKKRETNLERYGNEQFLGSEIGREKIRQGMFDKYGVGNAFQSEEVKEKIKETSIERYGFDHHFKDKDRAMENSQKVLQSKIDAGTIKLYDGKPISEWLKDSEYSDSRFRVLINKYGLDVARTMSPKFSALEQIFEKWLIEQKINYTKQFSVGKKKADFLLSDYNMVIELDGLYWHSELEKEDNYHFNKHSLYTSMNYRSFFFREDEIYNKFDIITSILNNSMNKSNSIFARKCEVIKLLKVQAKEFFEQNHLMGKGVGTAYALKYGDEVVSAILIKRTKNKNYDISRFCHKLGCQVIGGYSRLITHFLRDNEVDLLTTFIDRRYGSGEYLTKFGFEFARCSPSFCWTNTRECVSRMKFPGNTGYDNGFVKIWDCGQARYDLQVQS